MSDDTARRRVIAGLDFAWTLLDLFGRGEAAKVTPEQIVTVAGYVKDGIDFIAAYPERSDGRDVKSSGWHDATLKPGVTSSGDWHLPSRSEPMPEEVRTLLKKLNHRYVMPEEVSRTPRFNLPPNAEVSISEGAVVIRIPIAGTAPPGDRTARAAERLADDLRRLQPHP